MYAIVDIETTGGYSRQHGITEIAVVVSDGAKIVDKWESLINPLQDIPPYITTLTGINQSMVDDAPTFQEIAYELHDLLSDKVFVAHNVNFDFGFINHAFEEIGLSFNVRKLCTVRLSRKIIKDVPSYSLGKLTKTLGIKHDNPHRAMGDAIPTTDLFHKLYDRAPHIIDAAVKANSHEGILPANLPRDVFVSLPERPGVYYFHDAKGKVIYIGKAKNIKRRVNSHFTGRKKTRQQQVFLKEVFDITHELTGTELIAYLLEDCEIKHYWPRLNRAQKGNPSKFGAYVYTDREGNSRLAVNKITNGYPVIASFHSLWEARSWIIRMVEEYKLDPGKCGIPALTTDDRSGVHEKNMERLLTEKEGESLSYMIKGKGRDVEEISFIWVEEGNYRGFGFVPKDIGFERMEDVEDYLHPKKETPTVRSILNNYINQPNPEGLTPL